MANTIIINREIWETRVAVLEKGILQDLYFERHSDVGLEKAFIAAEIENVLPGIQTAFVNIGQKKSGFLHISEVDRSSYVEKLLEEDGSVDVEAPKPKKRINKNQMLIANFFKKNDKVLVQVKKEAAGSKGAKLTTCYTIPGKYLVLMPNINHVGISSKIEQKTERARLKEIIERNLPKEMGAIIRTDAELKSEQDLVRDLKFLLSTWKNVEKKFKGAKTGEILFSDLPIAVRTIREHIDNEEVVVYCDHQEDLDNIETFVKKFMPESKSNIKTHLEKRENLFEKFNINKQVDQLLEKKVHLKSGGNIIIEHTEAMTVVDVNSAKCVGKSNQDETSLQTNMEAAKEVVRQLRLRNIGGIIVIDFIDMTTQAHRQSLFSLLQNELKKKDKLKSTTLRVSELGLVQMTRKRSGKSIEQQLTQSCSSCRGLGVVKSIFTQSFSVLRKIKENILEFKLQGKKIEVFVSQPVFEFLSNFEFKNILGLESIYGIKLYLVREMNFKEAECKIVVVPN